MDAALLRRLGSLSCVIAISLYVLCTIASAVFFTKPFSPLGNWINDLGNYDFNSHGAIIYNAGVVIAGLLLIPFVASFATWHIGPKWSMYTLIGAGISGLGLCFGLIALGLLSENSGIIENVRFKMWIFVWGLLAFLLNVVQIGLYMAGYKPNIIIWLCVYSSMLWILLFCYNALGTRAADLMQTHYKLL